MHAVHGVMPLRHECEAATQPGRVVVLGAQGFLASRLIARLRASEIPCRPVGRAEVDLVHPEAPLRLQNILEPGDAVVFTSALTPEHGRDRTTFLKNLAMADHVCSALAATGCVYVVYVSSDSVYAPEPDQVDETAPCESSDLYALSHIVREKLLADTSSVTGVPLAIVRPTAIYGSGDTHNAYGPNRFLRSALSAGRICLFGEGEEERDHVYVEDVVRLIELCVRHRSVGVLNAASGTTLSFLEAAKIIMAAVGRPVTLTTAPRQVPIRHRRFDISALHNAFPGLQLTTFMTGVRHMLEEIEKPSRDRVAARTR